MGFFTVRSHTSSTSWMLQSSSYCSCGSCILDSSTCHGSCSCIGIIYMHACCHSRTFMRDDIIPCGDTTLPSPSSGANKLACAYCQASPAALVLAPSSGAPLLSLDHLIWSNIHGVMNFRVQLLLCSSMLFAKTRNSYRTMGKM